MLGTCTSVQENADGFNTGCLRFLKTSAINCKNMFKWIVSADWNLLLLIENICEFPVFWSIMSSQYPSLKNHNTFITFLFDDF